MDDRYPHFSQAEFDRRHAALRVILDAEQLAAVVVYGMPSYAQGEVQYLTNYATTREAFFILPRDPALAPGMFVQMYNHVPTARKLACIADVRWGGQDSALTTAQYLQELGLAHERVGIVGRLPHQHALTLQQALPQVQFVDTSQKVLRLRLIKSAEEIAMLRKGAEFTDLALDALEREVRPGIPEYALAAIVQGAYLGLGGRTSIHYMATTPMEHPSVCVPAQYQSSRIIERGDVLITELSAYAMDGYAGQIHRPFAIGAPPTAAYQRLFDVAVEAFARITARIRPGAVVADILDAAEYIHQQGFTIYDDLVHGYGGGYLPPVLRTRQTGSALLPDFAFAENMVIVVQPNIISLDEQSGVQVGELLRVTATGVESFHQRPMRFIQCGD
jgi:Xaa-Pro dipeptidase